MNLNRIIFPRVEEYCNKPYVMRTSTRSDMVNTHWVLNYFISVLLIEVVQKSSDIEIQRLRLKVQRTKEKANREAINTQIEEQGNTNAHEKMYSQISMSWFYMMGYHIQDVTTCSNRNTCIC